MHKILIFSMYITDKKEMKVNMAANYDQNFIYPLVVFKFEPKEPKLFEKSQNLLKISSKYHFDYLLAILN